MAVMKQTIIDRALGQVGISGVTASPTDSDRMTALGLLEEMMSELEGWGITLGYMFQSTPTLTAPSNLPSIFLAPIYTLLSQRLIPEFELPENPSLMKKVEASFALLCNHTIIINEVPYPRRMPRGSGNTVRRDFASIYFYQGN